MWQLESHPSPLTVFPSSHCSYLVTFLLSPHMAPQFCQAFEPTRVQFIPVSIVHVLLHPSSLTAFQSSQVSGEMMMPSPQTITQVSADVGVPPVQEYPVSTVHVELHPSPLWVFPSSHASVPKFNVSKA